MPLRPRISTSNVEGGEGEGLWGSLDGSEDVDSRLVYSDCGSGEGDLGGGGGDFRRPRGRGDMARAGRGVTGLSRGVEGMQGGVRAVSVDDM